MRPLNPSQLAAATANRPACILAGAGSGKTHTLVAAIIGWLESRLARNGAAAEASDPDVLRLLALTFTEKAAVELRERLAQAFTERRRAETEPERADFWRRQSAGLDRADIGTIHGFALKLIRENALRLGLAAVPELDSAEDDLAGDLEEVFLDWLDEGRPELSALLKIYRPRALKDILARCAAHLSSRGRSRLQADRPPTEGEISELRADFKLRLRRTAALVREGAARADKNYPPRILEVLARLETGLDEPGTASENALGKFLQKSGRWFAYQEHKDSLRQALAALETARTQLLIQPSLEQALLLADRLPASLETGRRRRGAVNFDDILILARRLLARCPDIRQREAERLNLIFIDEFQDTNRLQVDLLAFLLLPPELRNEVFDEEKEIWPNLDWSAVPIRFHAYGDLKQSIYRFRGAEAEVMADFKSALERSGGQVSALDINYRSQAPLTDFFNVFFPEQLGAYFTELDRQKSERPALYAGPQVVRLQLEGDASPQIAERIEAEARLLARYLELLFSGQAGVLVGSETEGPRRPRPGDVAVLFRRARYASIFQQACLQAGWPAELGRSGRLFDYPEVRGLAAAWLFLNGLDPELNLAAALRSPLGPVSDEALLRLIWSPSARPAPLTGYFAGAGQPWPEGLAAEDLETLEAMKKMLGDLAPLTGRVPPVEILERLAEERRLLPLAALEPDGEARIRAVTACLALSRTLGRNRDHRPMNPAAELALKLRGQENPTELKRDAIALLTVHKAKGLEFPVVVIAEADLPPKSQNQGAAVISSDGRLALSFRDAAGRRLESASYRTLRDEEARLDKMENRRLLYVAATRARDHLVFLGQPPKINKKNRAATDGSWLEALLGAPEAAARTGAVIFNPDTETWRTEPLALTVPPAGPAPPAAPEKKAAAEKTAESPPLWPALPLTGWSLSAVKLARLLEERNPASLAGDPEPDADLDFPAFSPTLAGTGATPGKTPLSPVEAGILFHAVMEIIDPREPYPRELLSAEAARLGLAPAEPEMERLAGRLELFLAGPLGQAWREALAENRRIFREWSFRLAIAEPQNPGRYLNVNGVIDLFLETADGGLIVDYKLSAPPAGRSLAVYENQIRLYAQALLGAGWAGRLRGSLYFAEGPFIREVDLTTLWRPDLWANFFKNFFKEAENSRWRR